MDVFNETPPIRVQRISVQNGLVMQRPGVVDGRTHGGNQLIFWKVERWTTKETRREEVEEERAVDRS